MTDSPFPGMNPYMEDPAAWAGVHLHILAALGQQLAPQLRPRYRVHTERYMQIGEMPRFRPDLRLQREKSPRGELHPSDVAVTEATRIAEDVPVRHQDAPPHLEILDERGGIVTVIELLSPINKQGEYQDFLRKRYQLLKSGVHLVELDLLRDGQRIPASSDIDTPYVCLVSRAHDYPQTPLWTFTFADACPILPVPLHPDDPDVKLQPGLAVAQAYAVEFEGFVDYKADPPGYLTDGWRQEIEQVLRAKNLRG
jgi:hypothetical protein